MRNIRSCQARRLLPAALLASTALAGAAPALAQTAVDELVVTAQKREQNIQKVPLSIQALGTQKLEQLQVTNVNDYVKFLPSVASQPLAPGFTRVFMRGVTSGDNPNHSASLPSVGTYLDEQPITTILGALDIHVYDIARVESLAGPQGTLYGASSQAGTIRIITNKPKIGVLEGGYDLDVNTVDHGDAGYGAEGFINLPVSDKAAIRLVGWAEHDGGYIDNVPGSITYPTSGATIANPSTAKDNYNDVDTYGGRAALKIDLDDNWTVTPTIMAQDQKSHGLFAYDPSVGDLKVSHFFPEFAHDRWIDAALTIEGRLSNFDITYAGAFMKRQIDSAQDYTDYAFFYDALFGYGSYFYDNSGTLIDPSQYIQAKDKYRKQSHELRIASPADARLRVVAGLFYQRQVHGIEQRYKVNDLADSLEVTGWSDTLWLTQQKRIDRDYAAFGEASLDLSDKLTLTAGGRVFKAHNSLVGFFGFGPGYSSNTGEAKCFAPAVVANSPCTNLDKSVSETGFTHRLNLSWQIDPDRMVYATWSRGFRPGGINRRGALPPYQSDYLTNYEAGWKTSWLEGRLRFNGSVFWEEWKNFQFSFLGGNGLTEIHNAPAARIKGIEADVALRPSDGLTLTAAAAYTDAKLTKPFCEQTVNGVPVTNCSPAQAPTGTRLPVTPVFKANATARYEFPVADFTAHVQGAVIYQGSSWADLRITAFDPVGTLLPARSALGKQRAYTTADFTAGLARGNWTVEAYLKNAFDERGDVYRYAECRVTVCGARTYVTTNQPRTLGVRVGQKF